ncbi:hypothetical protein PUN4_120044 [Paraburkholderia unamae]|nr:hypothetical protein PUN4_120044 [Paraburkholderia unamae]
MSRRSHSGRLRFATPANRHFTLLAAHDPRAMAQPLTCSFSPARNITRSRIFETLV